MVSPEDDVDEPNPDTLRDPNLYPAHASGEEMEAHEDRRDIEVKTALGIPADAPPNS